MPSRGRKFITDFLLPSLNEKKFGARLMWLDIQNKVFQIEWNHKSASDWTTNDAVVFVAWDKRQGHYNPKDKEYYPKSKQRFRAALYKFIRQKHITELYSEDKYIKIYCIGDGKNISGTYTAITRNKKENEGSEIFQIKENQNPEDLVFNITSIWNASLLTEPKENCSSDDYKPEIYVMDDQIVTGKDYLQPKESCSSDDYESEMKEEIFVKDDQIVADWREEFIEDLMYFENTQNTVQSPSISIDNRNNIYARESSNIMRESEDGKTLHIELIIIPEENIDSKITSGLVKCQDEGFYDANKDISFDQLLPCI